MSGRNQGNRGRGDRGGYEGRGRGRGRGDGAEFRGSRGGGRGGGAAVEVYLSVSPYTSIKHH